MSDTNHAKNRLPIMFLYFAAKFRTLLQTRATIFPSILPVSAKVAIFRNILPLSMQCINIVFANTSDTHRADLPVTI